MLAKQNTSEDLLSRESLLREAGSLYDGVAEVYEPDTSIILVGTETPGADGSNRTGLLMSGGARELRRTLFFIMEDNEEFRQIVIDVMMTAIENRTPGGKDISTQMAGFHLERLLKTVAKDDLKADPDELKAAVAKEVEKLQDAMMAKNGEA